MLLQMSETGGVAIVFGERAVGDDEDLDILKQAASRPEALAVVSVDLVEGLFDVNPTTFEFNVDERETVHEDGHVIAVLTGTALRGVLVDDLQGVVVDVVFLDESDVFLGAVIAGKQLDAVFLYDGCFVLYSAVGACYALLEEAFPFSVGE